MAFKNGFLLCLLTACAYAEVSTTTRTYELDVPGSSPIRIVEGEPLWNKGGIRESRFEHRGLDKRHLQEEDKEGTAALEQFLQDYADRVKNEQQGHEEDMESVELITKPTVQTPEEKSKSWNLLNLERHHHPYEDKKGWVSLEPVPWSISKISKWKPNYNKPESWSEFSSEQGYPSSGSRPRPHQEETHVSYGLKPSSVFSKPGYAYGDYGPEPKPSIQKPVAIFNQKLHVDFDQRPSGPKRHYHEDCDHQKEDIITDGLPANFPHEHEHEHDHFRRRGSDLHPDSHPFNGDGEWVLLSTTKGYKYPKNRQRSLQVAPESIGTHRSVRLTVLPPLKGSKVNMTTSHGGLLQVESTFETVDQAHKKYIKRQKLNKIKKLQKQKRPRPKPAKQNLSPTVASYPRKASGTDASAVLAAVGAGMIPATMAMLVPAVMNGRKRRDVRFVTSLPYSNVEMTLPKNL